MPPTGGSPPSCSRPTGRRCCTPRAGSGSSRPPRRRPHRVRGRAPAGDGALKAPLEVYVDPRAEWRQMYREVWRLERDFLYDAELPRPRPRGGGDASTRPSSKGSPSREDLNDLFREMTRQPRARSHLRRRGRAAEAGPGQRRPPRRRLPPRGRALPVRAHPLRRELEPQAPGAADPARRGREGGRLPPRRERPGPARRRRRVPPVPGHGRQADRHHRRPERGRGGLAPGHGRPGRLRKRRCACAPGWRTTASRVDELSGGRVGYVYIPDTFAGGFANFNRYYFSQVGKEARHPRRALQPRRRHRRLHRGLPEADAADGERLARRRGHRGARGRRSTGRR